MPGPQLVAVQRQAHLEAQGVAGAQASRGDPGAGHGVPHGGGVVGGHGQLDPVLARVAGAGHDAGHTQHVDRCDPTPLDRRDLGATVASRVWASYPARR